MDIQPGAASRAGSPVMKILIIDDHPLVTASLADQLRRLGHETAVAFTLDEGRHHLLAGGWDMCVLDLDLCGRPGYELLADGGLAGRLPPCVAILSGTTDPDLIAMVLDGGAHAFISKNIPFEDVVHALLGAAMGALPQDEPGIWMQDSRSFRACGSVFPRTAMLSPRERDVFLLLRQGLSDKSIAAELGRSVHTVRVQLRSIMRKRNSNRRSEIV